MREVEMLGGHPNNVVAVKYEPSLKLVFAASSSFVKLWDLRSAKCIRTLFSSGMSASWSNQQNNNGDPQMSDIALGENGLSLFTAAGDKVRVWDLRKFSVIGKLIGGHQAAVMCLAVGPQVVATGSKDHYIKLFSLESSAPPVGVLAPRVTLDPPHYDGIECLQLSGDILFSGSRDGIIKKWNITTHELLSSVTGAHKDWVTGLCRTSSGLLASGSRDGTVKLWSPDSSALVGEVKAHSSAINALTSNSSYLFTASNDYTVRLWTGNRRMV